MINAAPNLIWINPESTDANEVLNLNFDCSTAKKNYTDYIIENNSEAGHQFLIEFVNTSDEVNSCLLYFGNSSLDEVEFFYKKDGRVIRLEYQEDTPISNRYYRHPNCIFPIALNSNDTLRGLINIKHKGVHLCTDFRVYSDKQFSHYNNTVSLLYGGYFGLEILLLILIPLLLLYGASPKLILSYFSYHLIMLLFVADSTGYLLTFVLPGFTSFEKHVTIFIMMTVFLMITNLTKSIFNITEVKLMDYIRYGIYVLTILPLFIANPLPSLYLDNVRYFILVNTLVSTFWIICLIKTNYKQNLKVAMIFSLGIGPVIFSGLMRTYLNIFLPRNSLVVGFIEHSMIFAILIETLVFFGLVSYLSFDKSRKLHESKIKEKELVIANQNSINLERRRISQALHDGINSRLAGLKMLVSNDDSDKKFQIVNDLNSIGADIRSISHTLNPHTLNFHGLKGAIEEEIVKIESNNQSIQFKFEYDNQIDSISMEIRSILYYATLELIQNNIKHSNASEVKISIYMNEHEIVLDFTDNDVEFEIDKEKFGLGLRNIVSNSQLYKGSFKISRVGNQNLQRLLLLRPYT